MSVVIFQVCTLHWLRHSIPYFENILSQFAYDTNAFLKYEKQTVEGFVDSLMRIEA